MAESRGDRKPALEPPEVAALLLDLADAGCLLVDRGPPTESRGAPRPAARGLALFDAPPPPEPEGDGRTVAISRALNALRDRDGAAQGSKRERNSQLQRLLSRPFSTRFG